jgi:hypothetical protein
LQCTVLLPQNCVPRNVYWECDIGYAGVDMIGGGWVAGKEHAVEGARHDRPSRPLLPSSFLSINA